MIEVRFYGQLADLMGDTVEIPWEQGSIREVRERIAKRHPQVQALLLADRVRACVQDEIVTDDHPVESGNMVEFFPPVSGG